MYSVTLLTTPRRTPAGGHQRTLATSIVERTDRLQRLLIYYRVAAPELSIGQYPTAKPSTESGSTGRSTSAFIRATNPSHDETVMPS